MKAIDKIAFKYIEAQSKLNEMIRVNKDLLKLIEELQSEIIELKQHNITRHYEDNSR